MMVAVAIVGILSAVAISSLQQTRGRLNAERATVRLRGMIADAQSLAAAAGTRIGTANLVIGPTCGSAPGNIEVRFLSPTQIEVPVALTPLPPNGFGRIDAQVDCQVFDLAIETDGAVTVNSTSPTMRIFPNGRIQVQVGPNFQNGQLHMLFTGVADPTRPYGFTILPSGVMCQSSEPIPMAPGVSPCNENV